MGARDERIVRLARLPLALTPVPIYAGEPPTPMDCDWLAISCVTDEDGDESFILYFLDGGGRIREVLQFETLDIALDQAHAICDSLRVGGRLAGSQCPAMNPLLSGSSKASWQVPRSSLTRRLSR
jgi:hypothetical protein